MTFIGSSDNHKSGFVFLSLLITSGIHVGERVDDRGEKCAVCNHCVQDKTIV